MGNDYSHASVRAAARSLALVAVVLAAFCLAVGGCGTNFNELMYQVAGAAGRTAFDLWLTEQANQLADAHDQAADTDDGDAEDADEADDGADADDAGEGDADDGADAGDGGGGDLDDLTGDPVAGEAAYAANNCAACHCTGSSGDCTRTGGALVGVDASTLDEFLRGDAAHVTKPDLTDQEVADIAAYLASQGG